MTKKVKKDLQDSKNSSIFAAKLDCRPAKVYNVNNFEMVFERSSDKAVEAFQPGEALSIREMLVRTERGQRINVHTRFRAENIPDNMYYAQYDQNGNIIPDKEEDTFAHTPPDGMNDITDVMQYSEELQERKRQLKQRKKTVANAPESAPADKPGNKSEKSPAQPEGSEA